MIRQDYGAEVAELLDFIEKTIIADLGHGYFEVTVRCDIASKGRREVVVKAGKSYKFNIPDDQVPS